MTQNLLDAAGITDFTTSAVHKPLKASLQSTRFKKLFPGPYSYSPGRDGVDETFDIFCLTTDRYIASTYFWENREPCRLVCHVICSALNQPIMSEAEPADIRFPLLSRTDLDQFRQMHPGPYGIARVTCDYRDSGWEVKCTSTGESVICVFGRSFRDHTWLISSYFASMLNRLPD